MSDALADACQVLHGSSTNRVQDELRAGEFQIPSPDTLRMARLKLDYLSVMFERLVFLRFRYLRYVYIDASPQMGFNFLCMREERLRIPRVGDILVFKAGFNLSQVYETRLCFASVVGHRNATLLKKSTDMASGYLMESDSDGMFHEKRGEVKGCTSDQGTEKGLADDPVVVLPRFADYTGPDMFMYPAAMWLPGHLHIFFNALQEAIEGMDGHKDFIHKLRAVEDFLSDKSLRRAFQARCLRPEDVRLFEWYSTVHIDWKWEFLSKALDKLVVLIRIMIRDFDAKKISGAGKQSVTESNKTNLCAAVFADEPHFPEMCELLRVLGVVIEKHAHKLESCWCHSDIWGSRQAYKKRRAAVKTKVSANQCIWKGRMSPWWVAKGMQRFFD